MSGGDTMVPWILYRGAQDRSLGALCTVIYEGWKFNSGNYLFTTDTK